jgi:putative transposase
VTPQAQREAVRFLVERGLSERRACVLVGAKRATVQYRPRTGDDIDVRIGELARRHPRYGYRRFWALLRREGRMVNRKRVQRLWQQAQLQVRKPARRRRRTGASTGVPTPATHPGHVWTYDFVHDACCNGTKLKLLSIIDEFTRECLAIEIATALPSERVIPLLARLFAACGAPRFLRRDNGPEFIAQAIQDRLVLPRTGTLYIDPGCPWQNGFGESFNGTLRDECLKTNV